MVQKVSILSLTHPLLLIDHPSFDIMLQARASTSLNMNATRSLRTHSIQAARPVQYSKNYSRVSIIVSASQQELPPTGTMCSTCGVDLSKKPSGCDGEGRVIGGLGAVPGFGWWPIKAYRPCPSLNEAGVEYVRKGQAINEVLFGGVSLGEAGDKALKKRTESK